MSQSRSSRQGKKHREDSGRSPAALTTELEGYASNKDHAASSASKGSLSRRYRLDLAYRGTAYDGWQSQPSGRTIQDQLENVLAKITRHQVRVVGASRTDTGVHAEHQLAVFDSPQELNTRKLMKSLNALLADDIKVWACREVPGQFHPIRDCSSKLYRYRIWLGAGTSPFVQDYVWGLGEDLEISRLLGAITEFRGTHDFASFCASDSSAKTTVRTIYDIWLVDSSPLIEIYVHGNGFLKQMVRSIVGTLVEVARGRREIQDISAIMIRKDRRAAGMTAPAKGLSLVQIFYQEPSDLLRNHQLFERGGFSFWVPGIEFS